MADKELKLVLAKVKVLEGKKATLVKEIDLLMSMLEKEEKGLINSRSQTKMLEMEVQDVMEALGTAMEEGVVLRRKNAKLRQDLNLASIAAASSPGGPVSEQAILEVVRDQLQKEQKQVEELERRLGVGSA
eukprot:TRINITY_DN1466_c0_g1_i1.p1 TRINITY_DN1466_c0_g1~~TRINITY_DN1466_c0_g1_i1.p1  ORF type:complete len:131 (-),score=40.98 TRINITY_DN1466_c0_g1_i1:99-491(-)